MAFWFHKSFWDWKSSLSKTKSNNLPNSGSHKMAPSCCRESCATCATSSTSIKLGQGFTQKMVKMWNLERLQMGYSSAQRFAKLFTFCENTWHNSRDKQTDKTKMQETNNQAKECTNGSSSTFSENTPAASISLETPHRNEQIPTSPKTFIWTTQQLDWNQGRLYALSSLSPRHCNRRRLI